MTIHRLFTWQFPALQSSSVHPTRN